MIRTAYNTTHTQSGAKIETFLASLHGPGYLRISDPIGMDELLESCTLSDLNVCSRAHGLTVDPRTFDAWGGKTFVEGGGAWSCGAKEFSAADEDGRAHPTYFHVEEDGEGGAFITAYAEVTRAGFPTRRVQLDVEFD